MIQRGINIEMHLNLHWSAFFPRSSEPNLDSEYHVMDHWSFSLPEVCEMNRHCRGRFNGISRLNRNDLSWIKSLCAEKTAFFFRPSFTFVGFSRFVCLKSFRFFQVVDSHPPSPPAGGHLFEIKYTGWLTKTRYLFV